MTDVCSKAIAVQSKADLIGLLRALARDFEQNKDEWEKRNFLAQNL
jgi:hypothetical protein